MEMFNTGGQNESKRWCEQKSMKLRKVGKYFICPKIQKDDFGMWLSQVICSLDYRNISCCTSENLLSKVILKHRDSVLTLPP